MTEENQWMEVLLKAVEIIQNCACLIIILFQRVRAPCPMGLTILNDQNHEVCITRSLRDCHLPSSPMPV